MRTVALVYLRGDANLTVPARRLISSELSSGVRDTVDSEVR